MNLVFLLFFFLFIRSSNAKCRKYDYKLQLEPDECICSDLSYSPSGRIFNGTNLDQRDLLYVVAIYGEEVKKKLFSEERILSTFCTGSIISPRVVLTAGHCKKGYNDYAKDKFNTYVGTGSSRMVKDMHLKHANHKRIQHFIQHPEYHEPIRGKVAVNDIGLVVLKDPFKFDSLGILPGCLYMERVKKEYHVINKQVISPGYGLVSENNTHSSERLKFSRFKMTAYNDDQVLYKNKYTKTCLGDSGAPLLWKKPNDTKLYIIGVHSSSPKICGPGKGTNVATPVFNYIGWILEHVEGEICSTLDEIDDWFNEKDGSDKLEKRRPTTQLVDIVY